MPKKKPVMTTRENQPSGVPETQSMANATEGGLKATGPGDIVDLIIKDHLPLKDLIQVLKNPDVMRSSKEGSFEEFVPLLTSHAKAEEKTLYVEMKNHKDLRMKGFEGDTGHALAEQLMQEINGTPDDDEWNAKVKLLAELVENHIIEEEDEILPSVMSSVDLGARVQVGVFYTQLKQKFDQLNRDNAPLKRKSATESRIH